MKKNVRNALAISGLAIALGTSGMTLDANAAANSQEHFGRWHQERIIRTKRTEIIEKTGFKRRTIPGIVTAVADDSLTITHGSTTYTVNVSSTTKIFNLKWVKINLSDIQTGNKVRVLGSLSGTTITAKTVRDISLQ